MKSFARARRSEAFVLIGLVSAALAGTGVVPAGLCVLAVLVAAIVFRPSWRVPWSLGLVTILVVPFIVRFAPASAVPNRLTLVLLVFMAIAIGALIAEQRSREQPRMDEASPEESSSGA